jgi:flavin reductase (DIM6/NTAB) family NADH-FMN oxidoreductase RutF
MPYKPGKINLKPGNMLNPSPVVMVSCGNSPDEYNIITVAWTGTICSDPPMCYIQFVPNVILTTSSNEMVNLSSILPPSVLLLPQIGVEFAQAGNSISLLK